MARRWTPDAVIEDAKRYQVRSHWEKESSGAFKAAKTFGVYDICVAHMKPLLASAWTPESILAEAKKYTTQSKWRKGNYSSFNLAIKMGIFSKCTEHMKKKGSVKNWTKEMVLENACRYDLMSSWAKKNPTAFKAAKKLGILDLCIAGMRTRNEPGYWNEERVMEIARRYDTRKKWSVGHPTSLNAAKRLGIFDHCVAHMKTPTTLKLSRKEIEARIKKRYRGTVSIKWETFTGDIKEPVTLVDKDYGEYTAKVRNLWSRSGAKHPKKVAAARVAGGEKLRLTAKEINERLEARGIKMLPETYIKTSNRATFIDSQGRQWEALVHNVVNNNCGYTFSVSRNPKVELEIEAYLNTLGVGKVERNRKPLKAVGRYPLEVDFLIAGLGVAIEHHGLYWHMGEELKYKCQTKADLAATNGLSLLQFFEDEWRDKKDICKSIIVNRLRKSKRSRASKYKVREATNKEAYGFYNQTHLAGYARHDIAFCLYDDHGIAAMLSARRNPTYGLEIARFSSRLGENIIGAFSRLLKRLVAWAACNGYVQIMTYADRRLGTGQVYAKNGFKYDGVTIPDMFWTDKTYRYSRQKSWNDKTVSKTMTPIYGAGSCRYILSIPTPDNNESLAVSAA